MTEKLRPGSFYIFAPRYGALPNFFSFGRDKAAHERISALTKSADKASSNPVLASGTFNSSPSTFSLGGGAAAVVLPGLFDVAGELLRIQPNVAYDSGRGIICIFEGYLSNLDELSDRYIASCNSPTALSGPTGVLPSTDQRQLAAELVQRAYVKNRSGDLLVLLSELQGQYSFVVYDGEKHCMFAARDSSGKEPMFYEIDDDNALSVSNAQLVVPSDGGLVQWSELPPGHFISGRSPKVQQFALTPEQVSIREYYESLTDEFEGSSPRGLSYGRSSSSDLMMFPSL